MVVGIFVIVNAAALTAGLLWPKGYTASTTAARLAGRHGTKPIHPLTVARVAVLAKASSPVGALATGAYAGFLGYVARVDSPQASTDGPASRTTVPSLPSGPVGGATAATALLQLPCRYASGCQRRPSRASSASAGFGPLLPAS